MKALTPLTLVVVLALGLVIGWCGGRPTHDRALEAARDSLDAVVAQLARDSAAAAVRDSARAVTLVRLQRTLSSNQVQIAVLRQHLDPVSVPRPQVDSLVSAYEAQLAAVAQLVAVKDSQLAERDIALAGVRAALASALSQRDAYRAQGRGWLGKVATVATVVGVCRLVRDPC